VHFIAEMQCLKLAWEILPVLCLHQQQAEQSFVRPLTTILRNAISLHLVEGFQRNLPEMFAM